MAVLGPPEALLACVNAGCRARRSMACRRACSSCMLKGLVM